MSFTDPLGDLLTRIRNGQAARLKVVKSPTSGLRNHVLEVLKRQGYIRDYSLEKSDNGQELVTVELKYYEDQPVIKEVHRVSKPGRRVYTKINDLKPIYNGLGMAILSTPQGVMSDNEARTANVGGEVLCHIF
ncbi:MAG: ribosomal protein [Alphaproteobacteria bacterium]|nr:ribosomal protein [Alphaproteobacteria bacterium]